jgi:hypothetical protein
MAPDTAACNALFCVLNTHDDDQHTDVTGHTWTAPTPDREVIAHVYEVAGW